MSLWTLFKRVSLMIALTAAGPLTLTAPVEGARVVPAPVQEMTVEGSVVMTMPGELIVNANGTTVNIEVKEGTPVVRDGQPVALTELKEQDHVLAMVDRTGTGATARQITARSAR